jgi:hypothetical protein
VVSAETSLAVLTELTARRDRLDYVTRYVARALAWRDSLQPVPEPPSLEKLDDLVARREWFRQLASERDGAQMRLQSAWQQENNTAIAEASCRQELDDYVSQWGVCPTCGQPVKQGEQA